MDPEDLPRADKFVKNFPNKEYRRPIVSLYCKLCLRAVWTFSLQFTAMLKITNQIVWMQRKSTCSPTPDFLPEEEMLVATKCSPIS